MMGGMGRAFDGGYAEYTWVPAEQVIAFESDLDWATIGAVPGDAADRLRVADRRPGRAAGGDAADPRRDVVGRDDRRGAGQAARDDGVRDDARCRARATRCGRSASTRCWSTTARSPRRSGRCGPAASTARSSSSARPTLPDSLLATRVHGVVCFSGALSNDWALQDFYPIGDIPSGVRLTGYSGDAGDLPQPVLQAFLDDVAAGRATMPIARTYALDEIVEAHTDMESNRVAGKLVVEPRLAGRPFTRGARRRPRSRARPSARPDR